MHDKWIEGIPDVVPEDVADDDAIIREEIVRLHGELTFLDDTVHRRKTDLFEKHGIAFRSENAVELRLQLLIGMFIGHLTPERLNFEIRWLKMTQEAIEKGYNEYMAAQRAAKAARPLHLPGGKVMQVPPAESPDSLPPGGIL